MLNSFQEFARRFQEFARRFRRLANANTNQLEGKKYSIVLISKKIIDKFISNNRYFKKNPISNKRDPLM